MMACKTLIIIVIEDRKVAVGLTMVEAMGQPMLVAGEGEGNEAL
jgi:hypothetical protein